MTASDTTGAAKAAESNMLQFNQETFETVLELQMSFLDAATRFAQEMSSFAAHRAEVSAGGFAKLVGAKSPPEMVQLQLDHIKEMLEDYSRETTRLVEIAETAMKNGGDAVRSSYLGTVHHKTH